jgi:hypothetical protein
VHIHAGADRCVVRRFAPAVIAVLLGGCSDSNAPVAADTLLAIARVLGRGADSAVLSSATFRLGITDPATDTLTNRADLFGQIPLQNGDKGKRLVATAAAGGGFNRFASFLTDGINSLVGWVVSLRDVNGAVVGGGGEGGLESSFFMGRPGGGVDFAGYAITSVEFHVDSILFDTPGSDPYRDGIWTDYYLRGNVLVVGHRK